MVRKILFYLLVFISTLCILITMASLLYNLRFWVLKVLDFPREQTLIACGVCLALFLTFNRRWSASALLLVLGLASATALQAFIILPYTPLWSKAVPEAEDAPPSQTVSLVVANVWMKNRNADKFLRIISEADPDMLIALETNQWWASQLTPLKHKYPHTMLYPLPNTYGMMLYSKLPLRKQDIRFLQQDSVPAFLVEAQLPGGRWFKLYAVHPVPPVPGPYPDNIGNDAQKEVALLKVGKMVTQDRLPVVVAGDFNDVAWSNTSRLFGRESKLKDVRVGRGLYNSFNAKSVIRRWPLDQVYASEPFQVLGMERLPKYGSDHFPIYVKLTLPQK